jgi:hypothetical protein
MVAASVPRSRWGAVERAPTRPATREGEGRRDPALHVFRETANPKPMLIVVGTRTFFAGVAVSCSW